MKTQSTLKLTALGVIIFHFVIVVLHSIAHEVLPVKATPAQLAFIIPVIVLAPIVAAFMLPKFNKADSSTDGFDARLVCVRSLLPLHCRHHRPRGPRCSYATCLLVTDVSDHGLHARDLRTLRHGYRAKVAISSKAIS